MQRNRQTEILLNLEGGLSESIKAIHQLKERLAVLEDRVAKLESKPKRPKRKRLTGAR